MRRVLPFLAFVAFAVPATPAHAHEGPTCEEKPAAAHVSHARAIVHRAYAQRHWRDPRPFTGRPARRVKRHRACLTQRERRPIERYREARHKAFHRFRDEKVERRRFRWHGVTVKHVGTVPAQRHTLRAILNNGEDEGANARVQVSQIVTVTQEKVAFNTPGGGLDSSCAYQQRASQGWLGDLCGLRNQSDNYLLNAPTSPAIPWERANPWASIAEIAQNTQRSCCPSLYAQWEGEAWNTLRAWEGLP